MPRGSNTPLLAAGYLIASAWIFVYNIDKFSIKATEEGMDMGENDRIQKKSGEKKPATFRIDPETADKLRAMPRI